MTPRTAVLATWLLAAGLGAASAQEAPVAGAAPAPPAPDTSGWTCKFCTIEDGWTLWAEPGVAFVSDDSYRFGDYRGLQEKGTIADVAGGWRWRDAETAVWLDSHAQRRGSDARELGIAGGRQGLYRAWLDYDAVPHYRAADAQSPFRGGAVLDLPPGWTTAGSTAGMTQLDGSLRPVSLETQRERSALGVEFVPHRLATMRVEYRRDEVHGVRDGAGSFLTLASQLPQPVDQTLDRVDASLGLNHALGHVQLAFESSFFRNAVRAVSWDNPYNAPSPGATTGQLAQAPDNSAHRLSLLAGTPPGTAVQASAQLSLGRLEQDDRFLPATVNPNEAVALPRASLDGRVDTVLASWRASTSTGPLRFTVDVLRDDRDNQTPVAPYTQVVMDTFTGDVRANAPYGFTRNRWRFSAERRASPRVGVGIDDDRRERRLHGTGKTEERRYWGRVGWRPFSGADLKLRFAHARREGNEYAAAADGPDPNPLMRAYNTAERRRDETRADFSLGAGALSTSYHLTYASDEYPDTQLGRTSVDLLGYGTDVALQLNKALNVSAFAAHREQETTQAGSQAFGAPDWVAEQDDASNALGASLGWQGPRGLEVGAEYAYSTSAGAITMLASAVDSEFPLLVTRWHEGRVFARYPWRPEVSVRLDLLYERYYARDWGLAGVEPDTVANVVALGQGTQDGTVTAVLLGVRYTFGGDGPAAD
jgi:MtrB/PioB family decaheme-associated outer membrane protein